MQRTTTGTTVTGLAADPVQALLQVLREAPCIATSDVRLGVAAGSEELLRTVELRLTDGRTLLLICDIRTSGEPRFIRAAADRLYSVIHRTLPGAYGVVLAPYVSPDSAAVCAEHGVGFVDLQGNCLLSLGSVYIRREGRPCGRAEKRSLRSLYSPRSERILRVLLTDPGKPWRLQELATAAQVSLGQTHNVKTLLFNREWIEPASGGLRLSEPERLLREWADHYDFDRSRKQTFHSLAEPGEVEALLAEVCTREGIPYAFTGYSGAARVAPHVRYQRVHMYVPPEKLAAVADLTQLKPVSSGANVVLITPYDDGVYHGVQDRQGCVVSPVQLYLDLRALTGRGEDAAEFLMDTVLRKQW